jgi:hypothetical protein
MNTIKAFAVILFLTTSALTANAQERYEQMVITYNPNSRGLYTSTDTGEWKSETVPKSESEGAYNCSPALVRIKELSEQGWELYQNSVSNPGSGPQVFNFHLRRPLK